MTKAKKLRLALQAREALEGPFNRVIMPTTPEYEQKQLEALWTEYPRLSVLAHEVALEEESTKWSLQRSEEAREHLRKYVETCEGIIHEKHKHAFGCKAGL